MSRSGYSDDCDGWALIRWRGAVTSAIKGKRGQAFLRETIAALDALPEKRLVANELEADGQFCTLGAVGRARGCGLAAVDPYDRESVAGLFGISAALAAEIMFENDEQIYTTTWVNYEICGPMRPNYPDWGRHNRSECVDKPADEINAARWSRMRAWAVANLAKEAA